MSLVFKHSGRIGDVIWSLPTIRAMGGGTILLDPDGGRDFPILKRPETTDSGMRMEHIQSAIPLLEIQPYITSVRPWDGKEWWDHDLDFFRTQMGLNNIADSHLQAFGQCSIERDKKWLDVPDPIMREDKTALVYRNLIYHGNEEWWKVNAPKLAPNAVFVGSHFEHAVFEATWGVMVEWAPTNNLLHLARLIAGCRYFFGNQGVPDAIAEGLKVNRYCEVFRDSPASIFNRPGTNYF